jgi:hypothetical protein
MSHSTAHGVEVLQGNKHEKRELTHAEQCRQRVGRRRDCILVQHRELRTDSGTIGVVSCRQMVTIDAHSGVNCRQALSFVPTRSCMCVEGTFRLSTVKLLTQNSRLPNDAKPGYSRR